MYQRDCLTYFRVMYDISNFDPYDFCASLDIPYEVYEKFGTDCCIEIGRNERFNLDINVMIRETLRDLFGKEEILKILKEKYNLEYFLERVPTIIKDSTESNQILSLDNDIIEFLYRTQTKDDLDYFIL